MDVQIWRDGKIIGRSLEEIPQDMADRLVQVAKRPFKPQRWHLVVKPGGLLKGEEFVVETFATRKVAEESRDEWNADPTHVRDRGDAYICLCDCQDRECDYL